MLTKIDVLDLLKRYAQAYRLDCLSSLKRNSHMNQYSQEVIRQSDIDAILVDFINYVGVRQGIDYALYAVDLKEEASR